MRRCPLVSSCSFNCKICCISAIETLLDNPSEQRSSSSSSSSTNVLTSNPTLSVPNALNKTFFYILRLFDTIQRLSPYFLLSTNLQSYCSHTITFYMLLRVLIYTLIIPTLVCNHSSTFWLIHIMRLLPIIMELNGHRARYITSSMTSHSICYYR